MSTFLLAALVIDLRVRETLAPPSWRETVAARAARILKPHNLAGRPHQGLGNRLVDVGSEPTCDEGEILCRQRSGGVLKHYDRAAA